VGGVLITFAEAIFLGIIQGLTEFLPISSSGHLVLMKNLLSMTEPDLFFDVMVHFGTLIPILWIFREDLYKIFRSFTTLINQVSSKDQFHELITSDHHVKLIGLIGIAIVPTAIIGYFFKDLFEHLFSSMFTVGVSLILTGTLLLLTRIVTHRQKGIENMTFVDAVLIGFSQALAITPGISRSGTTISVALFLGINRELAGRFSFLISIPAILGAIIANFRLPELYAMNYFCNILGATIAASIIGYLALKTLLRFVHRGKIYFFSPYCYVVGLFCILFSLLR